MHVILLASMILIVLLVVSFPAATHYFLLGVRHDLGSGHIEDDSLGVYELIGEDDHG